MMVCTDIPAGNSSTPVKTIPVVYVIAPDWTMRTAVRAELREMGIELRIQNLVRRFRVVMIASRTLKVPLPDSADVLYRPVRIADIVARVSELLARDAA